MKEAPTRRQWLLGGGHLAALWAITFVQPLLDLLGKNPDFFVARGNTATDVLILSIGFMFLPPLVMLAVEWVAKKIRPEVYYTVHLLFFWAIATFLFIQIQSNFYEKPTILLGLMSLLLGGLLAVAVYRFVFLKNLMDILIVAPLVILLLFIFASKSTQVIFPKEEKASIGASTKATTPVVWVIFDELGTDSLMTRNGEIDGRRFPSFKTMEKESTWYPNETTTSYFTPTAVPGLLTGNRPGEDLLPTAADQPNNIFALLADSYKFHVEELITGICPESICPNVKGSADRTNRLKALFSDLKYVEGRLVLPPRIAATLPDVSQNFEGFGADASGSNGYGSDVKPPRKIDKLLVKQNNGQPKVNYDYPGFIRQIPLSDSSMTVMHILQPHSPWKFDVKGEQYNESPVDSLSEGTNKWLVGENGLAYTQQRHLVQTGYADTLLGKIISRIKKHDAWDKSMVIVTADHGVSFQGHGVPKRRAGLESMGEVANPPLFIKYPGQKKGTIDPAHSMTLDVVPTIAKELDVKGMYETEGVPLQDGDPPDREITVAGVDGPDFSISIEDLIKQRDEAVALKARRQGTGPLYTLGPVPGLIGKPAPPVPEGADVATLDSPEKWDAYSPGSGGRVPMNVTGELAGLPSGTTIAVGVNGKIRGTGRSFAFEGPMRFGTLVDPATLVEGRNEITVYKVGPDNSLTPLGSN